MPSPLAQELIDAIVDQVPRKNLTTCSLVAKSFLVPSQRRLFREIITQFKNARDLFATSPHLGKYIHSLSLCLTPGEDYAAIESVLRVVSNIAGLAILANAHTLYWGQMPASVMTLLKAVIVRPTFKSLSLTRIAGIPSSLIIHATSLLRGVSLYSTSVEDDSSSVNPSFISDPHSPRQTNLQELDITIREVSGRWKSVLDLDIYKYLSGLRTLTLGVCATFDVDWRRLLLDSSAHTTLQHLELRFQLPLRVLDLPPLPALRVLEIKFQVPNQTLPANLSHFIANLATTAPLLESLSFDVETVSVFRSRWRGDLEPYPLFASVDFVKQLPQLRKLHWSRNTGNAYDDWFEAYVEEKFPGPRDAGILDFVSSA
ncbi:hypothetical protein B0H19DRAFT_1158554 [Mycena capillaripes]|nr:hypothetical protein B0H19DRAFT_1158554 [Mycena capillaripes]